MSFLLRPPRVLRLLAEHGQEALKSRVVKGKYIRPLIPKRLAAKARKRAIIDGTFGSFSLLDENKKALGGWDPSWDTPRKFYFLRPPKGHIRERNRQARYFKQFIKSSFYLNYL